MAFSTAKFFLILFFLLCVHLLLIKIYLTKNDEIVISIPTILKKNTTSRSILCPISQLPNLAEHLLLTTMR